MFRQQMNSSHLRKLERKYPRTANVMTRNRNRKTISSSVKDGLYVAHVKLMSLTLSE